MSHTPGPWMVDDRIEDEAPTIVGRNPRRATIATVENLKLEDARLIAAAPDLLAALERIEHEDGTSIVPGVVTSSDGIRLAYVKDIARAAIAKAKGE